MLFLNRSFDKKRLKALLLWFRLNLSEGAALKAVETLQELGFRSATQGAISLGLDDLKTPASKSGRVFQAQVEVALAHHEHHRGNRTPVEVFQHLVDTWHRTSQDLTTEVVQLFHSTERVNPVYMMAFSGARGNISQVRQLVGMRGLMADPRGQIVGFPILSNFREGLTITEYFVSCYGARKGVVDTAIRTADAGYLTRRLADVSHHVVVRMTNCGTHRSIQLRDIKEGQKTILSLGNRLVGRVLAEHVYTSKYVNSANSEITPSMASNIASQHSQIPVRSPLTCSLPWGVCQLCYGWGLSEGRRVTLGEAVGIIAAQSIGEPGTQLTLRTFHTGGVFSGELLNEIRAPYAGNVFFLKPLQGLLIRTPHGQIAFLTKVFGKMSFQQIAQRPLPKALIALPPLEPWVVEKRRTPSEPCEVEEVQKVEYSINKNESSYSLRKKNIGNFSSNFLASDGLLRFQSFASLPKDTGFSDTFYPLRALVDIEDVSSKSPSGGTSMLEAPLPKVLYPYGLRGMVDITTFHYLLLAKRYSSGVCTRSKSLICFPYFRGVIKRNKSQMLFYVKQGGRKKMPSSAERKSSKSPFGGTSMLEAAENTGLPKVLTATWGMKNISQALGSGEIVAKRRAEMQQNNISLNITSSACYTKSIFFLLLPSSKDKLFRVLLNSKYFIRLIGLKHLLSSASPFLLSIPLRGKKLMFFKEKKNWANNCSFWSFPTNQKNHAYRSNARKDLWEDVNVLPLRAPLPKALWGKGSGAKRRSKKSFGEWVHIYRTSLPIKAPKEVIEVMQEGGKRIFHAGLKRKETLYPFRALTSSMLEAGSPIYFAQKTNFTIFTLLRKILRSMSFSFLSLKRYRQVAGIPEEIKGSPNFVTQNKQDHEFVIYPSTVIFVKQNEYVYNNQLLAEFSSSTLESTNNQIEITQQVLSETAGQVWFKEIDYGNRKGPGSGLLGTHFSSQKLGGIWVLAGKPKANTLSFNTYRASLPVKAPPLSKAPKEFDVSLEVNKLPIYSFPTITELISQKGKCKARSCMNVSFVTSQFPKNECISLSITSKEPQNCDVNSLKRRKEGIHNLKSHSLLCKVFSTLLDDLSSYTSSALYSFSKQMQPTIEVQGKIRKEISSPLIRFTHKGLLCPPLFSLYLLRVLGSGATLGMPANRNTFFSSLYPYGALGSGGRLTSSQLRKPKGPWVVQYPTPCKPLLASFPPYTPTGHWVVEEDAKQIKDVSAKEGTCSVSESTPSYLPLKELLCKPWRTSEGDNAKGAVPFEGNGSPVPYTTKMSKPYLFYIPRRALGSGACKTQLLKALRGTRQMSMPYKANFTRGFFHTRQHGVKKIELIIPTFNVFTENTCITSNQSLGKWTNNLKSFELLVTLIKGKEQLRANASKDYKEKQKIAKRSKFLPIQCIFLQKLLFLRKFPKIIAFSELFTRGKSLFKYCKFGIQNSLQQKRITYSKTSVINLHDDFRILNYNYLVGYSQKLPGKTSCISVAVPFSSVVQSYLTQRGMGSNSSTTQSSLASSIPHLHLFPKKLAPYHSYLFSIPSRSRALQLLVTNFLLTPLVQRRAFFFKGAVSQAPFRGKSLMLEAGVWPLALCGVYTSYSLGDINVPVNCSENLPLKGVTPINCIFQSVTKDHVQHAALKRKKHITKQVCTLKAQSNRYHHCYDTVPIGISKTIDDFRKSVLPKSSIPLLAESDLITFITNYSRFKVLLGPPNPFLPISYHQHPFLPTTYSPTEEKGEGKLLTYLPTPTGPWVVEKDAKLETVDISDVSSKSPFGGTSMLGAAPLGVNLKRLVKGTMSTRGLKKATVFPGQFVTYGDNIANNIVTTESGQALYIDSQKTIFRKAQTVLIYSQAIITVLSGEWIKKGTPLMSLTYQKLVTGDIVQGLPKIEQFFEAPVLKDGTFWGDSLQAKLNQFFQEQKEKLPLAEAVRKGFSEIQRILVEGVQRVYISQGVLIADKHLEVIVRQMTCKGRILYSGDTGFLRNELVTIDKIENVNQVTYGQKALYHPQVRGITDASLESESFLSAASFQETTRVLSRDAIIGKTDLMRGLKERVIVGELIQAGTGLANNSVYNLL